jgi:hypothetical protein
LTAKESGKFPLTRMEINLKVLISGAKLPVLGTVRHGAMNSAEGKAKIFNSLQARQDFAPEKASAWFSEYFLAQIT